MLWNIQKIKFIIMVPIIVKYVYHLKKNEKYLILWEPNHMTNIHNHDGKNCVFMKVRGDFNEKVYKNDVLVGENYYDLLLHMGEINDNIGKHSLKNLSDEIGVSIHIYY